MKSRYKQWVPWIAAVGILGFLFWHINMSQFFHALNQANLCLYLPLVVFFIIVCFLLESQNLAALFRHFRYRLSFSEVMYVRGVTYLLMVINSSLGIGGIALYLKQAKGIPLLQATSLMLFYMFIETLCLSFMATLGCLFASQSSELLEKTFYLSAAIFMACCTIIIIFKYLPSGRFAQKSQKITLWKTFREALTTGCARKGPWI